MKKTFWVLSSTYLPKSIVYVVPSLILLFLFWCPYMMINVIVYSMAVLRSIILRYAGAPIATRFSFFFFLLFLWRCPFFRVLFVPLPVFLCMESTPYVFSFRMVFFYLMTTGWIIDISLLCKNSDIKNSITLGFSPISYCCWPCVTTLGSLYSQWSHLNRLID